MANKRDTLQINTLGRQVFPGQLKIFMRSFELATQEKFSYLLLDWCSRSEKSYQLRTNILPGESTIVYHPIKWNKTRNTIWFCFLMDVPKQQFAHLLKIMTKE
jgi:hypothetical protein